MCVICRVNPLSCLPQFLVPNSPVSPWTSLLPLLFVLTTTGAKQAYEDWLRYQESKKENEKGCKVVQNGQIITILSQDIQVGGGGSTQWVGGGGSTQWVGGAGSTQ